jgi:hypothetical protein
MQVGSMKYSFASPLLFPIDAMEAGLRNAGTDRQFAIDERAAWLD